MLSLPRFLFLKKKICIMCLEYQKGLKTTGKD